MRSAKAYRRLGKRLLDLGLTLPLLIALIPLIAAVALVVRLALGSPVLFRQVRPGLHGKPYTLLKFRTMTAERGNNGQLLQDSERLTRLGRFLRSTSLDELPELFNVLQGHMSLVGPRPLLMHYLKLYSSDQYRRHEVLPGITGWAQVNGRNAVPWEERFVMDVWYVDHCSLFLDLRILIATVGRVLRREGIHAEGEATMSEFRGNC